ncbi:MAG: NUDIX domain-containing protein [Candidatus Sabulitectum sp.]|nr:NUDIX domain-containing protein [Candidatus Sabulitectum sp.]
MSDFTIGAFAIICNQEDQVLLSHRTDHDVWNMPGGGVESGESPWDAVVREVLEETGLAVEVKRLIGIYAKTDQNDIVFSFECSVIEGNLVTTDESDENAYFKVDELPENLLTKQRERIFDYFSKQIPVYLKQQLGRKTFSTKNQ